MNNIISLLDYKKRKLEKKGKKAASNSDHSWTHQKTPIHYMSDYLKTKESPIIARDDFKKEDKTAQIFKISDYSYKKKKSKKTNQSTQSGSKVISLKEYREKKEERQKAKWLNYARPFAKEALSVSAMALALLFSFSVFFQTQDKANRGIASLLKEESNLAGDKKTGFRGPVHHIKAIIKNSAGQEGRRPASQKKREVILGKKPATAHRAPDSLRFNNNSKSLLPSFKKSKNQIVIYGKKPDSSPYQGY